MLLVTSNPCIWQMIYEVWTDQVRYAILFNVLFDLSQGWKGSAKTRPLVLAIRDYFVERVEHSSKLPGPFTNGVYNQLISTVSTVVQEKADDDDHSEYNIDKKLPDDWVTGYIQVNRLRHVECEPMTRLLLPHYIHIEFIVACDPDRD